MRRKALIISNPGEKGEENYCEGVNKDVVNYKEFLMSPQGGYWFESEIDCLDRPSFELLKVYMALLNNADYTMIVFCGHGYSYKDETILELKKDCEVYADSLKNGAKKRTIILDCCRKEAKSLNESIIHEYASLIEKRAMDGMSARKYYDELISLCPSGVVVTYACDLDETAGDDSRKGGYYSYSLLQSAKQWAGESYFAKSSESIVKAHERATELTKIKSGYQQNPQIEKPKSTPHFPFVVRT